MAMIEILSGREVINLTAAVGSSGVNLKDDVLVVQAMLKYALRDRPFFRHCNFCEPTGVLNDATRANITEFQKFIRRVKKENIAVDGVIDRAVGEKPNGKNGEWTILHLNEHIQETCLLRGSNISEFEDLAREFPVIHSAIDNLPIGSLGLSLEPSMRGVGSLGLSLE